MTAHKPAADRRRLHCEPLECRRTPAVTVGLLDDINTSASFNQSNSSPTNFTTVGSNVFFTASTLGEGTELWITDGTAAGTHLVKDINPLGTSSNPSLLTNVNGKLYFWADDGTHGVELWQSDGTAGGTTLVKDINPQASVATQAPTAAGGKLFFFRGDAFGSTSELWVSDGTDAGTMKVKDFTAALGQPTASLISEFKGKVFFSANDGTNGTELWESDGTAAGTIMVKDIQPAGFSISSFPKYFTNVNGTLYFAATESTTGNELYKTDGTTAGTVLVADIAPDAGGSNPANLTNVGGTLFFTTNIGGQNYQLYKSNGTGVGTVQLKDFGAIGFAGSGPTELTNVAGTLFFRGYDSTNGNGELWKSDGTPNGTAIVKDIVPGVGGSNPEQLTNVSGLLFFRTKADDLWVSDGTDPGTVQVQASTASALQTFTRDMATAGGRLFFGMSDTAHGRELWSAFGNLAPVLNASGTASFGTVVEDATNPPGVLVSSILQGRASDPNGDALGIAIVGLGNPGKGKYQYSLNAGQTWTTMPSTLSETSALLLPPSAKVRFVPNANFNGVVKFWYRAWDQHDGQAGSTFNVVGKQGGAGTVSAAFAVAQETIQAVNDAPVINPGSTSPIGAGHSGVAVLLFPTMATVTDVDSANFNTGKLSVTGVGANDTLRLNGRFSFSGTSVVYKPDGQTGITIGTRNAGGGQGTNLQITLNSSASVELVGRLLRMLSFSTTGSTGTRNLSVSVSDDHGAASNVVARTINVS
jgi:ELWxxDGT repeat protein